MVIYVRVHETGQGTGQENYQKETVPGCKQKTLVEFRYWEETGMLQVQRRIPCFGLDLPLRNSHCLHPSVVDQTVGDNR